MRLEIYLNGRLLDRTYLPHFLSSLQFGDYLKRLKEELLRKHKATLSETATPPEFLLSGVSSSMNHFVPLSQR